MLSSKKFNTAKHSIRKKTISDKLRTNSVTFGFISIALICALSLFYLLGINNLAVKGYDIKSSEERLSELKEENQKLKIEAAELKTMSRLNDSVENLEMVSVKNISYISSAGSAVASR